MDDINNVIPRIQTAKHSGRLQFSYHAIKRMIERDIKVRRVEEALNCSEAEILEDYDLSTGRTSPACLILGKDSSGTFIHTVVAHQMIEVITAYEPTLPMWKTPRERGKGYEM